MARKKSTRPAIVASIYLAILSIGLGLIYEAYKDYLTKKYFHEIGMEKYTLGLQAVEINYGKEIRKQSKRYNLDAGFLMALCMLECSGRKKVPSRFEPHVYKKLLHVKKTKGSNYEKVRHGQISMLSNAALRNLASSWGPFQLMGVRSINLNCSVAELRGKNAVEKAVQWIDLEYGSLIRSGRFKDAFHKHNTGRMYPKIGPPKTFNQKYVNLGLQFMNYFELSDK